MKKMLDPRKLTALAVFATAFNCMTGLAVAQYENDSLPDPPAIPLFARILNSNPAGRGVSNALPEWNGSFTFNGSTFNYSMVGTSPFNTNVTTSIDTFIIPLKLVLKRGGTFDPNTVPANTGGLTAIQNTVQSPMFDSSQNFVAGAGFGGQGVSVGATQYIDAYQRANFWGTVQNEPNYHLLLNQSVLSTVTLNVPTTKGKTGAPFGETVALVDINWLDGQLHTLITNLGIQPNQLPIFVTYKTYLTQARQCCIGGYHSATGGNSYMHFTYIDQPGLFSQDVSALSHEVGEWADDPLINQPNGNQTPCGILENGDPLERNTNFGGFPYVDHGFTFNLQDLVTLPYFGAPASTSANGIFTFQGQTLTVCQNGA
ncbi:MAG: hypothetical protein C5B51_30015 [Terriglobia bacterium]|nr:MAG: hypothetical protein C5B51_30015 [Terriglobia bacterium]